MPTVSDLMTFMLAGREMRLKEEHGKRTDEELVVELVEVPRPGVTRREALATALLPLALLAELAKPADK